MCMKNWSVTRLLLRVVRELCKHTSALLLRLRADIFDWQNIFPVALALIRDELIFAKACASGKQVPFQHSTATQTQAQFRSAVSHMSLYMFVHVLHTNRVDTFPAKCRSK